MMDRALPLLALAACSSLLITPPAKPQPVPDTGVVVEEKLAPSFVVKPGHATTPRFNEPYRDALDARFAPLAEALRGKRDVRLDFVADDLAHVQARGGFVDRTLADFFAKSYGVIESVQQVVVVHAATADAQIAELRTAFGDAIAVSNVRLGFGEADGGLVAVLVYDLRVALEPFPRAISGSAFLAGTLAAGLDQLTLTRTGKTDTPPLDGRTFHTRVECASAGVTWLSLDAVDKSGAANLVQFPIACGGEVATSYTVEPAANFAKPDLARHVAAVINRERRVQNLAPLELFPAIDQSAHELARAKAAGVTVVAPPGLAIGTSRWTVFHSDSIETAIEHLLNDAGETDARTTRTMNRIGVGVEPATQGGFWIAIIYAQIPHPIDVEQAERWVSFQIKSKSSRRSETAPPSAEIARDIATQLVQGKKREDMYKYLQRWNVMGPDRGINRSSTALMEIDNLAELDAFDLDRFVRGRRIVTYGVGIAQNPATGEIWLVVVYSGLNPEEKDR